MAKQLVIVESPTKARTLSRFLGKEMTVLASMGHVRDLPAKSMGVDVANNFQPQYELTLSGKKVISDIRKAAKSATTIYLATDPDREGEAIAWHLYELLKNAAKVPFERVTFHEITRNAIMNAFEHPEEVDTCKVDAQQARRVLDRIVGYQVSPLLWEKVQRGTSAGRVQSVALRLVCEREREILAFNPVEYWNMNAEFICGDKDASLSAKLHKLDGKKPEIGSQQEAEAHAALLEANRDFVVCDVQHKKRNRNPYPPFITSTLQQAASSSLRMGARQTMQIAQQLYEGIDIGAEGQTGLITYMRTDSVAVAKDAQEMALSYIRETFGNEYAPEKPNFYRSGKSAQEAHEAIRPTDVRHTPESLAPYLEPRQLKLYTLIWNRFVASQMAKAQMKDHIIELKPTAELKHEYIFRAAATTVAFPGFLRVYNIREEKGKGEEADDDSALESRLPELKPGTGCLLDKLERQQCFTEPPPRFSEATLVRELEKNGVGRPSTYATIVTTIQQRKYVEREKGKLFPTQLGFNVWDFLNQKIEPIFDVAFTAKMESELDQVENGQIQWTKMLDEFYQKFTTWLGEKHLNTGAPQNEVIASLLKVIPEDLPWREPVKIGRRTYDDKKFLESIREQFFEKNKQLSDRQWTALLTTLARYNGFFPASFQTILNEIGLAEEISALAEKIEQKETDSETKKENSDPDQSTIEAINAFSGVTFTAAVKRGKRTYDDGKFLNSLKEQAESGKKLSPAQLAALGKIATKYRSQISDFEKLATILNIEVSEEAKSPEEENAKKEKLEAALKLFDQVKNWKEPVKRGKRTFDDKSFVDSLREQFQAQGTLSERQEQAMLKLADKYKDQIPNLSDFSKQYGTSQTSPETNRLCPECGAKILQRRGRGSIFYGCSAYPKCKFTARSLEQLPDPDK